MSSISMQRATLRNVPSQEMALLPFSALQTPSYLYVLAATSFWYRSSGRGSPVSKWRAKELRVSRL